VLKIKYNFTKTFYSSRFERKLTWWYEENIGGNSITTSKLFHPPMKKIIKWIAEITKCKYSAKKNISSIGPLYSVEYPATTSASVSEWSNGARLDSKNSISIKPEAAGAYKNKHQ
jgi:hypothetical protein